MPDPTKPRIILAGGSGFLGTSLIPALLAQNYEPVILTRSPNHTENNIPHIHWDARTPGPWMEQLNNAHAIINLVGRTVDCRKTPKNRLQILNSRIDSVNALASAFAKVPHPPKVWIQFATAHIYGDTHDEILDESSPLGQGFAPDVGRAWEKIFTDAHLENCRRVILRISFVLGKNGGPLKTLAALARAFLGGTTGTGRQYMSWLHTTDLNNIITRALTSDQMQGIYIATSPNPATNKQFMQDLHRAVNRPWSPPVPAPIVRLGSLLLRTDPELALLGRRCLPTRLLNEGFTFQFPTLPHALNDLLRSF